jgi:hypothetical protein
MDFFFVSPEMSVDVNDSLNCYENGVYGDFGSANNYVNAKTTDNDLCERNLDCNLNCNENGVYGDFGSANSYVNANTTNTDICVPNLHCTTLDLDKLRIGDEEIVPKAVLGIHDPHSNVKRERKLLALNGSSPSLRYVVLLYMINTAFKIQLYFSVVISLMML